MKPVAALRVVTPLLGAAVGLVLSACETTPSPGSDIRAQVHAVPLSRPALDRGADHGDLHAALRAGATAADAKAQRVVLAGCGLPEAGLEGSARLYTVTTVLPAGVALLRGAVLQLKVDGDPFSTTRLEGRFPAVHGHFKALAPAGQPLDGATGVPWRLKPGDKPELKVRCWPVGGEPGLVQVAYFRTVSESEMHFATAEAARHALFSDAELAAGRVVRVRCRLRMADGAEWHTPEFLARAPGITPLQPGDVVQLRAGVDEGSRQGGPVGLVLARKDGPPATARPSGVDCR